MARRARDGKAQELAASRTLNPRPEAVVDEAFRSSEFFDARDLVQVKYEMVRRVEADGVVGERGGGRVRVLAAVVLHRGAGAGRGGPGGAGAGQAGAAGGAQADRRGARPPRGAAGGRPSAGRGGARPPRSPSGSGSRFIAARWSERSPAGRPPSGARKVADDGRRPGAMPAVLRGRL